MSLEQLLKGREPTAFTAQQLGSKAHYRWDRGQHAEAALLFEAAAKVAQLEFERDDLKVNQRLNYRARHGINLSLAGEHVAAKPILRDVIQADWHGDGLGNDSHMVEWAYVELLKQAATQGTAKFEALFDEAISRCSTLGWDFPRIHPKQELLLQLAMDLNSPTLVERVAGLMKNRRPLSRAARQLLKQAENPDSIPRCEPNP